MKTIYQNIAEKHTGFIDKKRRPQILKEGKERRGEREKGKVKRRKREWKSYEREGRPEGGGGEDEMEQEGEQERGRERDSEKEGRESAGPGRFLARCAREGGAEVGSDGVASRRMTVAFARA